MIFFLRKFNIELKNLPVNIVDLYLMSRKVITYFLFCVLALQLLPFREMGKLFYYNQITEEICDTYDAAEEKNETKEGKKSLEDIYLGRYAFDEMNNFNILDYFSSDTILQSRIADDKPTPPPLMA